MDSPAPRIQRDDLTGRPVFLAPGRSKRPSDLGDPAEQPPLTACPFCAGNEQLTPPTVLRWPTEEAAAWHVRIVPNRYPFIEPAWRSAAQATASSADHAEPARPAHGVHEVVIESPDHVASILDVPEMTWQASWLLVRDRLAALAVRPDLAWAMVFKNSGLAAGASLAHVHSQLVALDFVPPQVAAEFAAVASQPSLFADLLSRAREDGRVVARCEDLVAIVPPAARQPFEVWILPEAPEPHYHATGTSRVRSIATLTRWYVRALAEVAPGTAFNWWLHEAATSGRPAESRHWHWHLEMLPRHAALAGFELGTGCHVSTLAPVAAAHLLRTAVNAHKP